jgi:hypothetical protein
MRIDSRVRTKGTGALFSMMPQVMRIFTKAAARIIE